MKSQTTTDLAISRIVDRSETLEDWAALDRAAIDDSTIWHQLTEVLRDDCTLRLAIESRVAVADRVSIPVAVPTPASTGRVSLTWIVGAAAAFLAMVSLVWPRGTAATEPQALLDAYVRTSMQRGRLLERLEDVPVEIRAVPGQEKLEVIYVRRFVERTFVDEAWELASDEHGRPQPARVDLATYKPASSF